MKSPAVIGFYGESNTGKTTIIIDIIKHFSEKGLKIASIKISDKKISIDTEGKDTWKHINSGSDLTVFSSKIETDFLLKKTYKLNDILNNINQFGIYDLIIVEGANDEKTPKIRIGNIKKRENTIKTFSGDVSEIKRIIEEMIHRRKTMEQMSIKINKKNIPISEFPGEIIKSTICAMMKSLKGVDEIKTVEISFEV